MKIRARSDRILKKIAPFFPLTRAWIVKRHLCKESSTILDVGCGRGWQMETISKYKNFYSAGIDLFMPNVSECKKKRIYDECIVCDVRFLPFRKESFDIAICLEVIEHTIKSEGLKLIQDLEEIARTQVIISTPNGFLPLLPVYEDEVKTNPLQVHKSGYLPIEFERRGYEIEYRGLRTVWKLGKHRLPVALKWLFYVLLPFLSQPLIIHSPNSAAFMMCFKNKEHHQ